MPFLRLELAERLQCPRAHRPTPMVVVAWHSEDRELLDGVAGCPMCRVEARIAGGDVVFPGAPDAGVAREPLDAGHALRVVALLALTEPGGAVLLTGRYVALAAAIRSQVDVSSVALNPPTQASGEPDVPAHGARPAAATVRLPQPCIPFTDGSFRGAAFDADTPLPVMLDSLRALAAGARVLAARPLEPPHGLRVLASDAQEWVAEKEAGAGAVVPLLRRT